MTVTKVLCAFIGVYTMMFWLRAILSWFPIRGSLMGQIQQFLHDVTEPVLAPVRRVVPPAGAFDLSFMIVGFVLLMVWRGVCAGG